jgi:hypothetical protein
VFSVEKEVAKAYAEGDPEIYECLCVGMLFGQYALRLLAPGYTGNDEIEAQNCLYNAFRISFGDHSPWPPSVHN